MATDTPTRDPQGRFFCDGCAGRFTDHGRCDACDGEPLMDLGDPETHRMLISLDEQRIRERDQKILFAVIFFTALVMIALLGIALSIDVELIGLPITVGIPLGMGLHIGLRWFFGEKPRVPRTYNNRTPS